MRHVCRGGGALTSATSNPSSALTTLRKVTISKLCIKLCSAISVLNNEETRCIFGEVTVDCGGRLAKAPYSAPTTYQVEPDVRGQNLIFLILIL